MALIYAQPILIPLVLAVLIWFVVKKLRNLIDKIQFIERFIPNWIKTFLASFIIFSILVVVSKVLINSIDSVTQSYERYASNIDIIAKTIKDYSGMDINEQVKGYLSSQDFEKYLQSFAYSLSDLLGNLLLIVFYSVFLFLEEAAFQSKINIMFNDSDQRSGANETLQKIDQTMARYIGLKSMIALMTSALSFIVLYAVGIDSPMFWAFLVFAMNFIPAVGPIIATLLPALFALIQFGEFTQFFIIIGAMGSISVLIGNFLEPRLMGNTLNISPLVAVLSLAVWGSIWGVLGMLLSVPITVAMIIVFSQFKSTRPIAILLSEKGRV
jgi:predicted PurR-regulated permease PerM